MINHNLSCKGRNLIYYWKNSFFLSTPNIQKQVNNLNLGSGNKGSIDWILKSNVIMITSRITFSLGKIILKNYCSRCLHMVMLMALILRGICNQRGILKEFGWCLTIANACNIGQPWATISMIHFIIEYWPLQFSYMQYDNVNSQMLMWNAFVRVVEEHGT
jgi:hypothetical protein